MSYIQFWLTFTSRTSSYITHACRKRTFWRKSGALSIFIIFLLLFNDALNTFYLRLYGVRHMVKDHSDSEKGNLLPPHRLLLSINSKGSFICTIP